MKNFLSLLILGMSAHLLAQPTLLFHENFDLPSGPDSVTVSSSAGINPILWNDTTFLSTSPTRSFHLKGSSNSTVSFETQAFSTLGANLVYLSFNHIAKVYAINSCKIYISINNGSTWNLVTAPNYLGNSQAFMTQNEFDETSYFGMNNLWNFQVISGPNSIPDSSWWVQETFDLTSLAKQSSGSGYPQVKLKFEGTFPVPSSQGYLAGWFVDDVNVVDSPCEIEEPEITFRNLGFNCYDSLLTGAYNYSSTFNRQSYFDVTDNIQVDSVRALEIVNGVPRPYSPLSILGPIYSHQFSGYNPLDTVKWAIEAYDTCGNMDRFPKTGFHMFYFADQPAKCAGGECDAVHQLISSFPWSEDFEGADWIPGTGATGSRGSIPSNEFYEITPAINQSYGWSVYSGVSTSPVTGTTGDHTSGTGNYLYTNFKGQNIIRSSTFILPCIDLRDSVSRTLSFYYHMYGADVERLKIDIDTTPGLTEVWEPYLKILGEQQTSLVQPWRKATISLEPFKGKILRLRFFGRNIAATSAWDNIAIDDLQITNAPPRDVALFDLSSPNLAPCASSAGVSVDLSLYNKGFVNLPAVPLAYQLDNGAIIRDTLITNGMRLNDSLIFSFAQTLSYNPGLPHIFKVWAELGGDTDHATDTLALNIPVRSNQTINTFPHFLTFENAKDTGGNYLNIPNWTLNPPPQNVTFWSIDSGYHNNTRFGPIKALGPKGKALFNKISPSFTGIEYAQFESGCIDLLGLTNPELRFQYFSQGSEWLEVWIREPGQPWTTFNPPATLQNLKDRLIGHRISLASYTGKSIQIVFKAKSGGDYFVALDDIIIGERPTVDLALRDVERTRFFEGNTVYSSPKIHFTNWGHGTFSPNYYSRLKVELINKCNPTAASIYGTSDSLLIVAPSFPFNGAQTFANLTFTQAIPPGEYLAKYWLESNGDQFSGNDTAYVDAICQSVITPPYFNDFESCAPDVFTKGPNTQWEIGTPQKASLSSPHSGTRCAITNIDTNLLNLNNGVEFMELPGIQGLDTLFGAELRLWQNFDFGTGIGKYGVAQIFDGTTYSTLYNPNIAGNNWGSLIKPVAPPYQFGFTGSSNGWIYSSYPLVEYRSPGAKYIRFITPANEVPGWAIDDIEIFVPPQNSGSPVLLTFNNALPVNGPNPVSLKITNTGAAPLNKIDVFVEHNGTVIHQETITFANPILSQNSKNVALAQPINLNPTMNGILVRTSLPNNRHDVLPQDDTLMLPLYFLAEVDSLPQCFGFENDPSFAAFDHNTHTYDTTWTYGTPSKVLLNSAHNGSKAWFTQGASYARLLNQYLFTPVYEVSDNTCYRLSFWQNFDTEKNFDGGNVEFSVDSGDTWQILGMYMSFDSLWYNIPYVQSLDQSKPGFSGSSGGWSLARYDFKVFGNPADIQFRFRFASNADISGEGWAIDDVCVEAIGTNCQTIGLEPKELTATNAYLYPVPTSSLLNLRADLNGTHHLSIYDQRGALVKKWKAELNPSEPTSINIERLPAGVYWLKIGGREEPVVLKFIKE